MLTAAALAILEEARSHRARAAYARELAARLHEPEAAAALFNYAIELEARAAELEASLSLSGRVVRSRKRAKSGGRSLAESMPPAGPLGEAATGGALVLGSSAGSGAHASTRAILDIRARLAEASNSAMKALDIVLEKPTSDSIDGFRQSIDGLMRAAARARLEVELKAMGGGKQT